MRGTRLGARTASTATLPRERVTILATVNAVQAGAPACTASNTLLRIKKQLLLGVLRFRIVTPRTTQGTPLEKNRGANTGTVVHTKALDLGHP